MSLLSTLLAIASALPALLRAAVPRRPPPPAYRDPHHWSEYDLRGERVPRHCVYCKQLATMASQWCPGSSSRSDA